MERYVLIGQNIMGLDAVIVAADNHILPGTRLTAQEARELAQELLECANELEPVPDPRDEAIQRLTAALTPFAEKWVEYLKWRKENFWISQSFMGWLNQNYGGVDELLYTEAYAVLHPTEKPL